MVRSQEVGVYNFSFSALVGFGLVETFIYLFIYLFIYYPRAQASRVMYSGRCPYIYIYIYVIKKKL